MTQRTCFKHIVVGAGALGTATAYRLATSSAGQDALVLEQFEPRHTRGASEDHSRIIRYAYHSPAYTALTEPMYRSWKDIEDRSGLILVTKTGGLDLAMKDSAGAAELDIYRDNLPAGIEAESLNAAAIRRRWPQWRIADDVIGLYQPDGGILDIRRACAVHTALALSKGVTFLHNTVVTALESSAEQITVYTNHGTFTAESVILCVASWLPTLLAELGLRWNIQLSQEQVSYFVPAEPHQFSADRFPIWMWHGEPFLYGFPVYGEAAVKLGRDVSGRWITSDTRSYRPDPAETARLAGFLQDMLPGAHGPELYSRTCVYDLTPDRDFIIDRLPGHPRILVAIGAGHAGKFASLIGEILAELATMGRSSHPIDAFRADRPGLTDAAIGNYRLGGGPVRQNL